MVYNKSDFLRHIDTIKPVAFDRFDEHSVFEKVEPHRKLLIYLASREYFPHGSYIDGVSGHIIFNEIENKLTPLYLAEGVKNSGNYTLKNSLVNIEGVDYQQINQEINDYISFVRISEELKKLIDAALLFFEQFKTIEDVAVFLADKEPKEIVPFIQGTILLPKTILILKLADHPKFKEKRDEFYELVKEQAAKKKQAEADLKVFEKLFIK